MEPGEKGRKGKRERGRLGPFETAYRRQTMTDSRGIRRLNGLHSLSSPATDFDVVQSTRHLAAGLERRVRNSGLEVV